ncbi:lamin tail domain-containing protein [Kribbella sp. NBC_01484]|uniref:lamin tail domain-containing protein n=1 Tax=Kribbella sp. NBC_01484 TaxID=2903579 RepID=UPI002E352D13|nr:lamin tail domain-containing protein [Kribbella sp. NBC_01484]
MSAQNRSRRRLGALVITSCLALSAAGVLLAAPSNAASPDVVITEVYGGGGNSGAPYTNDFVELTNNGSSAVDVSGWSVQYASSTGATWQVTKLTGSIAPGAAYLVQEGAGAGNGAPMPTPDVSGTIAMSASAGKVALVTNQTALACGSVCHADPAVRDYVGFGSAATDSETAPTGTLSNTSSAARIDPTKDTDNNGADFAVGNPSPGTLTSTPTEPPVDAKIHDIQGAAHRSPLEGKVAANVTGVVTAKTGNGFWFQDPQPDTDPATSEGLFVFTSSAPTVSVGDAVTVQGSVAEFRPGGSGGVTNLTTTELTNPTITVTGTAAVPAPTIVGPGGRVPPSTVIDDDSAGDVETTSTAFDPANDGLDFWESLEGMWLGINEPQVTGPTSSFRELSVVPAGSGVRTVRGGILLQKTDSNPERVLLDDVLTPIPDAKTGDKLAGVVTGVLDYSFGNFKFLPTVTPTVIDGGVTRETTKASSPLQVSVATFNVENLDPSDGPAKFDGLAKAVVNNLASPDILGLEEVQDNDGATNSGTTAANLTLDTLVAAIQRAGGPTYTYRQIDPVNNQEGGEPGGNIRVAFMYRTDKQVKFVDRPGGGSTVATTITTDRAGRPHLSSSPGRVDPANPAWAATRVPLAGEFTWHGQSLFVVVNHFSSKGGDDPLWGRFQPPVQVTAEKRHQQAQAVRGFVDQILAKDKGANVVVLGDLNDFDWSETADILVGAGKTALIDMPRTLPLTERYSYVFEGNSQILDQILISKNLQPASSYDVVHMNAEFPDQISDHDPQVVRLTPLPSWVR